MKVTLIMTHLNHINKIFTLKKRILKFFFLLFIAFVINSCKKDHSTFIDCNCIDSNKVDLKKDLVLHYNFENGSAVDVSGNNNNGFIFNQTSIAKGIKGNALRVVGKGVSTDEGGHVILPRLKFEDYGDFSINLWVYEESWTYEGGNAYIMWGDENTGILGIVSQWERPRVDLFRHTKFSVGGVWSMIADPNDPKNVLVFDKYFPDSLKINTWVFYTLNYKNGIMYCYRNSDLIGSLEQKVKIGIDVGGLNRHWWGNGKNSATRMTGMFDELRIFKRALNTNEIKELFNEKQ